jgi:putative transposase
LRWAFERMTQLHHYDKLGTARFITFGCHHQYKLLTEESAIQSFLIHLHQARGKYGFLILGYVVMPDHVHLVLYPKDDIPIGEVIGEIKSRSAREILAQWKAVNHPYLERLLVTRNGITRYAFWQRRCYDHNCRMRETVLEKIEYCHHNPVKRGLVDNAADWKWSSYNWYNRKRGNILEIDDYCVL